MKKLIILLLILMIVIPTQAVFAEEGLESVYNGAKIVVYNPQTDKFLFDQKGDDRAEPAVATRMVSLMVVYDYYFDALDTKIVIEKEHLKNIGVGVDPSTPMIGLKSDGEYTVEELMNAVCVTWANDALNPLIHAYCRDNGITYKDFTEKINEFAQSVGCEDTLFKEPLGRRESGNRTTAIDVALLCTEFYNRYDLFQASCKPYYNLQGTRVHTKNFLLSELIMPGNSYKGCKGIFAGQATNVGDYCIATAYENGPMTYIVVVLEGYTFTYDPETYERYFEEGMNPYTDVKTLIEWAKSNFSYFTVCRSGDAVGELLLEQGKDSDHVMLSAANEIDTVQRSDLDPKSIEVKITYNTDRVYTVTDAHGVSRYAVKAPVTKGEILGMAQYVLDGEILGETSLIAAESTDAEAAIKLFDNVKDILFSPMAKTILTVVLVIAGLYVAYCITALTVRVVRKVKKDAAATQKEQKLKELREKKKNKK